MRIAETSRTKAGSGCTCRCNACDGGHHCGNLSSGCHVRR